MVKLTPDQTILVGALDTMLRQALSAASGLSNTPFKEVNDKLLVVLGENNLPEHVRNHLSRIVAVFEAADTLITASGDYAIEELKARIEILKAGK